MRTPIIIEYPGLPRPKERARFSRKNGKFHTPKRTRKNANSIGTFANIAMRGRAIITGGVKLSVVATFPVPKSWRADRRAAALLGLVPHVQKPDADNIKKQAADALKGIVFKDDAQIVKADIEKKYGVQACLRVEVREIKAQGGVPCRSR